MYILFFLYTFLAGILCLSFFPKHLPFLVKISLIYLLGTFLLTILFFIIYPLKVFSPETIYLPFVFLPVMFLFLQKRILSEIKLLKPGCKSEVIVGLLILSFSAFLFLKTVWFDFNTQQTLISGKLWSDFGAHIPLMRSFFPGFNFPPEYPVFAHAPIKYYFMFHFHLGLLEYLGLPLFLAIDIPSILGISSLLFIVYAFGELLFQKKLAGLFAVAMFFCNASLSWWYFIKNNYTGSFFDLIKKMVSLTEFPAFNPYDKTLVSGGFWNLNVYTNQRHLGLSLALLFLLLFLFVGKRIQKHDFKLSAYILIGLILGFTPLFHGVVFLLICLCFPVLFCLDRQKKYFIFMGLVLACTALPSLWYLKGSDVNTASSAIKFLPGYLTAYSFTWFNFVRYWLLNLGLVAFLAPIGFFLAPRKSRQLFLYAIPAFLVGNLFSFSPDVATNHKFFNFSIIIFDIYVGYFLALLFTSVNFKKSRILLKIAGILVGVVLLFFLTISGIIDLFPVFNDNYFGIPDPSHKADVEWIKKNTDPRAVFANSYYLFHPANLAGRRISLGWPYFAWSAGYDTETRVKHLTDLYLSSEKKEACREIKFLNVDFVTLNLNLRDVNIKFDEIFWKKNFPLMYDNSSKSGFLIFEAKSTCSLSR